MSSTDAKDAVERKIRDNQDLVAALEACGLKTFLTQNKYELCNHTIDQSRILTCMNVTGGIISKVKHETDDFDKNCLVYERVEVLDDPAKLIDALVRTDNDSALKIIRDALEKIKAKANDQTQTHGERPPDSSDSKTTTETQPSSFSSFRFSIAEDGGCLGKEKSETYECKNVRVLFINQKFDSDSVEKLNNPKYTKKKRHGAEKDGPAIETFFKTTLKMTLEVKENVTSKELPDILREFKDNCVKDRNDGCIVIISTHGSYPDRLLMDDLVRLNLHTDVLEWFGRDEFKDFVGKPKIFVFNACRSTPRVPDPVLDDDSTEPMPVAFADMLIVYSTLALHKSKRVKTGPEAGSCFIQTLCKMPTPKLLKTYTIIQLINMVGRKVAEEMEKKNHVQIVEICGRFFEKNFYLKPQ